MIFNIMETLNKSQEVPQMDEERYQAELDHLSHLLQEDVDDNLIEFAETYG